MRQPLSRYPLQLEQAQEAPQRQLLLQVYLPRRFPLQQELETNLLIFLEAEAFKEA